MALFDQIKELLGLGSGEPDTESTSRNARGNDDVAVTVEHEPDTESEDAVKGTGAEQTDVSTGDESATEAATDGEADTEQAEVTGGEESVEDESEGGALAKEESDGVDSTGADTDGSTKSASTEDVQSINGIGPAYAERLAEADVETVGDLAAADAESIAKTTSIALSRVEGWIEQARE